MKRLQRVLMVQAGIALSSPLFCSVMADFGDGGGNVGSFFTNISGFLTRVVAPGVLAIGGFIVGYKILNNEPDAWPAAKNWFYGGGFIFLVGAAISLLKTWSGYSG